MSTLVSLGFDAERVREFAPLSAAGLVPARIVEEQRTCFTVATEAGECVAVASGRLRGSDSAGDSAPTVGDWVGVVVPPGGGAAAIRALLTRRSALARRDVGG